MAAVVAQMLHETDLGLVFDGLVRGAIFTDTEGVVRPDIDHVQLHERSQSDGRLHVVRKDEEGAADGQDAAVQRHAVHHAGHRQLTDAHLQELPREVALGKGVRMLEEAVRLVRVAEVGGGDDHVLHLLRIERQHGG